MKKSLAILAGAACFGLLASAASAASLGAAGSASAAAAPASDVIQVHGIHSSCKVDGRGWHRSYLWGRQRCAPPKHHHYGPKHGPKHHYGKKKHH